MKTKVALLCLGLVSAGFCVDEYLPIAPKTLEVDVGVNPVFPKVGDAGFGIPLQVKYGVMPGLDLEVATSYALSGNQTGLNQPDIAAKYAIGASGFAAYLDLVLPFSTGDYDAPGAGLGIAPGVVYGRNFDKIQAVAKASYLINMEKDSFTRGNVLDVYLKPGYMIDSKLAAYVGLDYKMYGESDPKTTDGSGITLAPGVTYTLDSKLSFEANVPIVLSDDVNGESWGIWAAVYYTLPM